MELGSKISICRQNMNMTQEELAVKLGVTPQAISMYERNVRMPDVTLLSQLCKMLGVSADYLLGINENKSLSCGNISYQEELMCNLRNCIEPFEMLIGKELALLFVDGTFEEQIANIRLKLSKEGIIMPIVRIRDDSLMKDKQFMILSYQNVLHNEICDDVSLEDIMQRLEHTVRNKYAEIITPDIAKNMVDNLKEKYPALIENIIPEKISYGILTLVLKSIMVRGNGIMYLPKVLECMQYCFIENPNANVQDMIEAVTKGIEKEDNYWVYMAKNNLL
ncbi:MAG: helix-turn-helix domain-containing protein [Lachnospiraceae bacterium]|nr:helix-turn-helix domain-containing protein [Lachnospiraceae bacterium]